MPHIRMIRDDYTASPISKDAMVAYAAGTLHEVDQHTLNSFLSRPGGPSCEVVKVKFEVTEVVTVEDGNGTVIAEDTQRALLNADGTPAAEAPADPNAEEPVAAPGKKTRSFKAKA